MEVLGGGRFLMSEVPLYPLKCECEDRVLDGPASGGKGSKVGPYTYCNPRT